MKFDSGQLMINTVTYSKKTKKKITRNSAYLLISNSTG